MIRIALSFFLLALLSYFVGANQIGGASMEIARLFLWAFLVLALVSGIVHLMTGRPPRGLP